MSAHWDGTYHALALLDIDLVAKDNLRWWLVSHVLSICKEIELEVTYKWEVFWVTR